ncbi:MAG: hypothetical protein PHI28_15850, partial [Mangrovibacterium sp.]|nr:hypothetical protein [Mangrovibacterium sp.]
RDGDLEKLIRETGAGKLFDYDGEEAMEAFLKEALAGQVPAPEPGKVQAYSRKALTAKVVQLLREN